MKNEFMLAFNEICEARGLPKEVVIDALKTALVSAYRRNTNVSNTQEVAVDIDERTGEPTIYAEKEVVDSLFDGRTEVLLSAAHAAGHVDAELGDMVMMVSTPENFGRIAAQTAKQVILQRVREAERDMLYDDFSAREGEIVNGTVQSVSGQNITVGLGRTEAVMPKSQQVPGERYRAHDKIRVFVLEVRRTSRGPQIIVSRNHRSLLRRLLELEVPEIFNGQVDIKSIAREAGARSKVAVMAMQPGIDPVGACVGMRGVRIQSIVRELNEEKIDVIEWDSDQRTFIAKALSPARVSQVFLEDHPYEGRTAIVIVPDDQLSLAIGREGQNARLAAKLTSWRIDIKSLTEAATESLNNLDHPVADQNIARDEELIAKVKIVLAKKVANRPITSEDYMVLNRLVSGIEGNIVAEKAAEYEEIQKARQSARKSIPAEAWDVPLEDLLVSERVKNLLVENHVTSLGEILIRMEMGEESLLEIAGFGAKALEEVQAAVDGYEFAEVEPEIEVGLEAEAEIPADQIEEAEAGESEVVESVTEVEIEEIAEVDVVEEIDVELEIEEEIVVAETVGEEDTEAAVDTSIDDLATPLVKAIEKKPQPKKRVIVVQTPAGQQEEEETRSTTKGKQLVFDEQSGTVVVKRKRKGGRARERWEDVDDIDIDELLEDEF